MTRTKTIYLALLAVLLSPLVANAAPIEFTFTGEDGFILYDGAAAVPADLTVVLEGDTDDLVANGGPFGGDLYSGLQAFFSSDALGFSNVLGADLIDVVIGLPSANRPEAVVLVLGGAINGLFGGELSSAIPAWDRISDLGPLSAFAISNGRSLTTSLDSGQSLVINQFDGARPFGDATFSASVSVPEPGTLALLGLGLVGMAARRRKTV